MYGYDDTVIMKKTEISDVAKDLERLYARVDKKVAKYGPAYFFWFMQQMGGSPLHSNVSLAYSSAFG